MNETKRQRLAELGWVSTTVKEVLDLTPQESAYIEFKLTLSRYLHEQRKQQGITQVELAEKIGSSQSRVAKMEKGGPSVSVDLIVKSLFAMDVSQQEIAKVLVE